MLWQHETYDEIIGVMGQSMSNRARDLYPVQALGRETLLTQIAARDRLSKAAIPGRTLAGYGMTSVEVFGREIVIDAQLAMMQDFVTAARAKVKRSEEQFHEVSVGIAEGAFLARVYDQDGRIVHDWPTIMSLAVLMRVARMHT